MTENFLLDCQLMVEENIKSIRREARKGYGNMGRGVVIADFEGKKLVGTSYLPIVALRREGFDDEELRLVIKYKPPGQAVVMAFFCESEKISFHLINFLETTEQAKNKGFGKKTDKLSEYLDITDKVAMNYLVNNLFS